MTSYSILCFQSVDFVYLSRSSVPPPKENIGQLKHKNLLCELREANAPNIVDVS